MRPGAGAVARTSARTEGPAVRKLGRRKERMRQISAWLQSHCGLCMAASFLAAFAVYASVPGDTLVSAAMQSAVLAVLGVVFVALCAPLALRVPRGSFRGLVLVAAVYLAVVALATTFVEGAVAMPSSGPLFQLLPAVAVLCLGTGVFEEALFRVVSFKAVAQGCKGSRLLSGRSLLVAAVATSVLFGLLHISPSGASAAGAAVVPSMLAKPVQAALFGFVMAAVLVKTRSLWPAAAIHALYDFAAFAPGLLAGGQLAAQVDASPCAAAAGAVLLIPAAAAAFFVLNRAERRHAPADAR